ncbi:MAG: ferritin-like domain-containing protein [Bacteroidota bacterium]|nr:ferritin-like domain-containing protein [Ferruginibacter sp.]
MPTKNLSDKDVLAVPGGRIQSLSRRNFLGYLGGASALLVTAAACKKDDNNNDMGVDLGSGDVGILNYAYALEQIEAAFYTKIFESPYANITPAESALLGDIRDHEIAHREFFKTALAGGAIPTLELDFSSINFSSRDSVLAAAKTFEDLGVSAYNGAGKLIMNPDYLVLAGKIVSVEARHAAYIRDLISNGSFADNTVVDAMGLDKSREPSEVLTMASSFVKTKINASNLPTS